MFTSKLLDNDSFIASLFLAPTIILIIVLFFYPISQTLWLSFTKVTKFERIPYFVGFDNYIRVFSTYEFYTLIMNSAIWTSIVVAFQFLIGLFTALLLAQDLKLRSIARGLIILPWAMPGAIAGYLWKFLLDSTIGPFNWFLISLGLMKEPHSWLGSPSTALLSVVLSAIWKGFPFSTLMYLAAIQSIPKELLDAADVDGAGFLNKLRFIIIPYIMPIIRITLLLTTIWTFNYFDLIWVMTKGGPRVSSHIFPTYIYQVAFEWSEFGTASVYAIIDFIILCVFSILYIVQLKKGGVF